MVSIILKIIETLDYYSDLMIAVFTFLLLVVGWRQLSRFTNQVRADFMYRLSRDLDSWLNDHKEARDWIFNNLDKEKLKRERFNKWEFDDYLGFFETIWSFDKKKLVDKDIVYDLFSDYLISVYEANDFELRKIIEDIREEDKAADLYEGLESLYKEMKKIEEKKLRRA